MGLQDSMANSNAPGGYIEDSLGRLSWQVQYSHQLRHTGDESYLVQSTDMELGRTSEWRQYAECYHQR